MDPNASSIPQFTGDGSHSFVTWRRKFEDYLGLHGALSSAQKAARLRYFLDGSARDALDGLNDTEQEDYATAIAHLHKTFVTKNTKKQAKMLLKSCNQQVSEPVPAFASRIRQLVLAATADMPDEAKAELMLDSFVENLRPSLSYQVQMRLPDNFERAYEVAIQLEALAKAESQESAAFAVHAAPFTDWRLKFEKRLDRIEMLMEQLANDQQQQYHSQSSHSDHWHGNSNQPPYDGADDWEGYEYEDEVPDLCDPDLEYAEHSTSHEPWDSCNDNDCY